MKVVGYSDWFTPFDGSYPRGWNHIGFDVIESNRASGYRHRRNVDGTWSHWWYDEGAWVDTSANNIAIELLSGRRRFAPKSNGPP